MGVLVVANQAYFTVVRVGFRDLFGPPWREAVPSSLRGGNTGRIVMDSKRNGFEAVDLWYGPFQREEITGDNRR